MEIKRITQASQLDVSSFNTLLDPGMTWDEEQGEIFLSNPDNVLLVAVNDAELVGFLTAHRLQRFDKRKAEVLLYEIGVNEPFQRQGIGKALVVGVKAWAKDTGADEVWVLTEKDNQAAMSLYSSAGGIEDSSSTTMFTYKLSE